MKTRKPCDIESVLLKKGFKLNPQKQGHKYFCLYKDGIKQGIFTKISHGKKEYDKHLMGQIKKQMKISDNQSLDDFFDCPMSKEQYLKMLEDNNLL